MTDTNVMPTKPTGAQAIPVEDRIFRTKRLMQEVVNAVRTSKESGKPMGARNTSKANAVLADVCGLLDDIFSDNKVLDGIILKLKEDHPRDIAEMRRLIEEREVMYNSLREEVTENCNAQHQIQLDHAKEKSDLQTKLLAAEQHIKDIRNLGLEAANDLMDKAQELRNVQAELESLQVNYTECLERLFKARLMKPAELFRVAEKFLPEVVLEDSPTGFYVINPEWHKKVVDDLELDLNKPGHRNDYTQLLIIAVCALYNKRFQVKGDKAISCVVCWDNFLISNAPPSSPTFSAGSVSLFPAPQRAIDVLSQYAGAEPLITDEPTKGELAFVPVGVGIDSKEPSIFAKDQTWVDRGLFTISEEWVSWAYNNAGIPNEVEDIYKRNAFRTVLSERVRRLVKTERAPVVVIDWDGCVIMGSLNFSCPELSELANSYMDATPAEVVEKNFYL